jgi:hypothetical protein
MLLTELAAQRTSCTPTKLAIDAHLTISTVKTPEAWNNL